jgi:hypothetical protein
LLVVQAAAVAVDEPAGGIGDQVAERVDSVLPGDAGRLVEPWRANGAACVA